MALLLVTGALFLHSTYKPYMDPKMNFLEGLSLVVTYTTFFCGSILGDADGKTNNLEEANEDVTRTNQWLGLVVMGANGIFALAIVTFMIYEVRSQVPGWCDKLKVFISKFDKGRDDDDDDDDSSEDSRLEQLQKLKKADQLIDVNPEGRCCMSCLTVLYYWLCILPSRGGISPLL